MIPPGSSTISPAITPERPHTRAMPLADLEHPADLADVDARLEAIDLLTQNRGDLVCIEFHGMPLCFKLCPSRCRLLATDWS